MNTKDEASSHVGTDLSRWRLKSTEGNYHWMYLPKADVERHPQSFAERYFLALSTVRPVSVGW